MSAPWKFDLYVDAEWSSGEGSGVIDVIDPATEQSIGQVPEATVGDGPGVAGTVDDHVGRYRALAEAGVQTAIVRLPVLDEAALAAFAPVIAAFAG